MENKLCPLSMLSKQCVKEHCAGWDEERQDCRAFFPKGLEGSVDQVDEEEIVDADYEIEEEKDDALAPNQCKYCRAELMKRELAENGQCCDECKKKIEEGEELEDQSGSESDPEADGEE